VTCRDQVEKGKEASAGAMALTPAKRGELGTLLYYLCGPERWRERWGMIKPQAAGGKVETFVQSGS